MERETERGKVCVFVREREGERERSEKERTGERGKE